MSKSIVIIQGHPDSSKAHFCHALAQAYCDGAREAGHRVTVLTVTETEFPILRSQAQWSDTQIPPALQAAQQAIRQADHLLIVYPLWLGSMPALLKAFLEQVLRPGFAMRIDADGHWDQLLKGKSARVVITMGMPAAIYRWYFRAHSLKSLERNILRFVGIKPVKASLIGGIENLSSRRRERWLATLRRLGARAR